MITRMMPQLTPEEEKEKARRDDLIQRFVMDKIPPHLKEGVYVTEDVSIVGETMKKVLEHPDTPPKKKRYIQALFDQGFFDQKTVTRKDEDKEKKLNDWINKKIDSLIEQGVLPDPKTDPLVAKINEIHARDNREEA